MNKWMILFLISLIYIPEQSFSKSDFIIEKESGKVLQSDTLLFGIQGKITKAFLNSYRVKSTKPLDDIVSQLEELSNKSENSIVRYWNAYTYYYKSIVYVGFKQNNESEKSINKGIEILKNIRRKNSEDYALLALLQGFSLRFKSGIDAGTASQKASLNAEKAVKLDNENLRAYYVLANNDYYTPVQYGGGKKVEELLLKAIKLNEQKVKNPVLPSWGKDRSYTLLVQHYMKSEDKESAKKYLSEGLIKYPENYDLNQLSKKLNPSEDQ
ncbi:MAG: hypothetical protein AAF363_02280 [Bacteroidota bacterium]